jgi:hypothetical protein
MSSACYIPSPKDVAEMIEKLETALERFKRVAVALNRS